MRWPDAGVRLRQETGRAQAVDREHPRSHPHDGRESSRKRRDAAWLQRGREGRHPARAGENRDAVPQLVADQHAPADRCRVVRKPPHRRDGLEATSRQRHAHEQVRSLGRHEHRTSRPLERDVAPRLRQAHAPHAPAGHQGELAGVAQRDRDDAGDRVDDHAFGHRPDLDHRTRGTGPRMRGHGGLGSPWRQAAGAAPRHRDRSEGREEGAPHRERPRRTRTANAIAHSANIAPVNRSQRPR